MVTSPLQRIFDKVPARLNVGLMLFMTCFLAYMARGNISLSILAMVHPRDGSSAPDYGKRYDWDSDAQAHILGAYFYGYLTTSLLGGTLSEWFGGRIVIFSFMVLTGALTALSPLLADISFWYMFIIRFLVGSAGGVAYPALHCLVSKWAPPTEKGKFVASLLGGNFGTVITWVAVGFIIEHLGWIWSFYIPAIFIFVVSVIWWRLVYDRPAVHPRISESERNFIEKSLGDTISGEKRFVPIFSILTSVPFWALLILHYGNLWGLYFLLTVSPNYMSNVLGFKLGSTGFLASLPHLARVCFGVMFGQIGDFIRRKQWLSVTAIRKSFTLFSHIIPGCLLILIGFVSNPYWNVAIMTMSLGFNGASTITNLQNSQDLAPNFAGNLYGLINFVGTTTGFITPLVASYFTRDQNTAAEWQKIFLVGAAMYIGTALIFIAFGSGQIQPWNESKRSEKKRKESEGPVETAGV